MGMNFETFELTCGEEDFLDKVIWPESSSEFFFFIDFLWKG